MGGGESGQLFGGRGGIGDQGLGVAQRIPYPPLMPDRRPGAAVFRKSHRNEVVDQNRRPDVRLDQAREQPRMFQAIVIDIDEQRSGLEPQFGGVGQGREPGRGVTPGFPGREPGRALGPQSGRAAMLQGGDQGRPDRVVVVGALAFGEALQNGVESAEGQPGEVAQCATTPVLAARPAATAASGRRRTRPGRCRSETIGRRAGKGARRRSRRRPWAENRPLLARAAGVVRPSRTRGL